MGHKQIKSRNGPQVDMIQWGVTRDLLSGNLPNLLNGYRKTLGRKRSSKAACDANLEKEKNKIVQRDRLVFLVKSDKRASWPRGRSGKLSRAHSCVKSFSEMVFFGENTCEGNGERKEVLTLFIFYMFCTGGKEDVGFLYWGLRSLVSLSCNGAAKNRHRSFIHWCSEQLKMNNSSTYLPREKVFLCIFSDSSFFLGGGG